MTTGLVAGSLVILAGLWYGWVARQAWRSREYAEVLVDRLSNFPCTVEFSRGMARAVLPTSVSFTCLGAMILTAGLGLGVSGAAHTALFDLARVFLALDLLCAAGFYGVALFNRPRILALPHMRDEPGSVAARRGGRRRPSP